MGWIVLYQQKETFFNALLNFSYFYYGFCDEMLIFAAVLNNTNLNLTKKIV